MKAPIGRNDSEGGTMSEEPRKDEAEDEVEGHVHRAGMNDEPSDEGEDEVEAHVHRAGAPRTDAPRAD
jgi:hypothetical protein